MNLPPRLSALLDHLAPHATPGDHEHAGWHITRITGGWNNLLYRVTNAEHDLAIKFTIRDARDRAGREFAALTALRDAGLVVAPTPVLIVPDRYALPVVVQTWVEGAVLDAPPATDSEWLCLLEHYAAIHTLTPDKTPYPLRDAVVTMRTADEGRARVRDQLALLPADARSAALAALLARFEQTAFPAWDAPRVTFCRVDPNITNFIRRAGQWWSVDWENSGWGDPAFEIADLIVHPAYRRVEEARWEWVIETYCNWRRDPFMATRIGTYRRMMLVWWAVRCARYLSDIPQGKDRRLVDQPTAWQADFQAKSDHYLNLANRALSVRIDRRF